MHLPPCAIGCEQVCGEGVQVRLIAGRDLQRRRLDFDKTFALQPIAQRTGDAVAGDQEGAAVGVAVLGPPGGRRIGGRQTRNSKRCGRAATLRPLASGGPPL